MLLNAGRVHVGQEREVFGGGGNGGGLKMEGEETVMILLLLLLLSLAVALCLPGVPNTCEGVRPTSRGDGVVATGSETACPRTSLLVVLSGLPAIEIAFAEASCVAQFAQLRK